MLNKFLYSALKAVFQSVGVENENMPADIEPVYSSTNPYAWKLPEGGYRGEQYTVGCPFCNDHRQHLHISYTSYARPLINGTVMTTGPLRAQCMRRNCIHNPENRDALEQMIQAGFACVRDGCSQNDGIISADSAAVSEPAEAAGTSSEITLEGIRTWVPDFRYCLEDPDPVIMDYLSRRRVTEQEMHDLHIGWGKIVMQRTKRVLNRGNPFVIFPIIMNGALKGVQARCPDKYYSDKALKYWIHPGLRKSTVVYNIDRARDFGVGVLCEGIFDVLSVGQVGICCFGHTPSPAQQQLLTGLDKGIILLPDTDYHEHINTVENAAKLAMEWNASGVFPLGAHSVVLPSKDAGEMTRQEVWENIVTQVPDEMRSYLFSRVLPNL